MLQTLVSYTHSLWRQSAGSVFLALFLRALFILWWFKLSLMTWERAKPSSRASCLSLFLPVSFVWLRCVYAPQARHCMCVSMCGRYEVPRSALCSCCVSVCICTLWASTNILNEHYEHTLWTNIEQTHFELIFWKHIWMNNLKTQFE